MESNTRCQIFTTRFQSKRETCTSASVMTTPQMQYGSDSDVKKKNRMVHPIALKTRITISVRFIFGKVLLTKRDETVFNYIFTPEARFIPETMLSMIHNEIFITDNEKKRGKIILRLCMRIVKA